MQTLSQTVPPTEQETRLARESIENLAPLLSETSGVLLRVCTPNHQDKEVSLPLSAVRLLLDALQEIGQGNGVTLTPVRQELTTQQAADFLMVSRPFLIEELLEKGMIPFRKVGNRRRIRYTDLHKYRQGEEKEIARGEKAMLELMAETERQGLYS